MNKVMEVYYNWKEILINLDDGDLYSVLNERDVQKEKLETAKLILLDRNVISINNEGQIIKKDINAELIKFVAIKCKINTDNKVIVELEKKGFDNVNATRIVNLYRDWVRIQLKKRKIWTFILVLCCLIYILISIFYSLSYISSISLLLIIIPIYFYNLNSPSSGNFKKKKLFYILKK